MSITCPSSIELLIDKPGSIEQNLHLDFLTKELFPDLFLGVSCLFEGLYFGRNVRVQTWGYKAGSQKYKPHFVKIDTLKKTSDMALAAVHVPLNSLDIFPAH